MLLSENRTSLDSKSINEQGRELTRLKNFAVLCPNEACTWGPPIISGRSSCPAFTVGNLSPIFVPSSAVVNRTAFFPLPLPRLPLSVSSTLEVTTVLLLAVLREAIFILPVIVAIPPNESFRFDVGLREEPEDVEKLTVEDAEDGRIVGGGR